MKKINVLCMFSVVASLLTSCGNTQAPSDTPSVEEKTEGTYSVRFLANIPNVNVTLSSGIVANGNNILYETKTVKEKEKVSAPDTDPVRVDYDFAGWFMDVDGNVAYDFTKEVTSNINLYAKWTRSSSASTETYTEPKLSFVEKVDNSVNPITISGVLNSNVENGSVKLTTIGIRKLTENKDNVKELLNYSINGTSPIKSAVYDNNKITVTLENNSSTEIMVSDVTGKLVVSNSYYEQKAKNYEANSDIAPYNIVLGGSSSMENWSTSTVDMEPLTTVNVGIGGTTVDQWDEQLAQRLIYPFSPREVVLYVGINNIINAGDNGEVTGNKLVSLFDNIHSHLPDTTIFYVLMNLVPDYMQHKAKIEQANEIATNYGKDKDYMQYIDAGTLLMKESGKPNRAYFLSDGLHMSLYGYIIWGQKVKNSVIAYEKEKYHGTTQN